MNKQDLIDLMATAADISKAAANRALDALTHGITNALVSEDSVALIGFGTFDTSLRKARTGRNPQTGAIMQIPAMTVARFRAGKALKDAINHRVKEKA